MCDAAGERCARQSGKPFMGALLGVAEKACKIARILRLNVDFGSKLINQKADREKGDVIEQDYVSFADVFIQCVVKHDLELLFPELHGRILGEEADDFTSPSSSATIAVNVQPSEEETVASLVLLLGDDMTAIIREVAAIAHRKPDIVPVSTIPADNDDLAINLSETALWIDPIDGTSSYIKGKPPPILDGIAAENGTLSTVTFLLGAFNTRSGAPFCGVVAQPFAPSTKQASLHCARYFWGISTVCHPTSTHALTGHRFWGELSNTNAQRVDSQHRDSSLTIVHSKNEKSDVLEALKSLGKTIPVGGAGYKLLIVVRELADAFVLSLPTTYPWDTCGPHAIIRAMGGSVVDSYGKDILYSVENSKAHDSGIFASLSSELRNQILTLLP